MKCFFILIESTVMARFPQEVLDRRGVHINHQTWGRLCHQTSETTVELEQNSCVESSLLSTEIKSKKQHNSLSNCQQTHSRSNPFLAH